MASWFTRALDRVTPWDRGGEVQRRQEKKKKQDDEQNRSAPARNTRSNQQQDFNQQYDLGVNQGPNQGLQPKKPTNIFETLNKNLNFGQPNSTVSVFKTPDTQPAEQPKPGTIVKPKQNLFDKVRDQFDANTEADKYRREQGNIQKGENKDITLKNPGNIIGQTPIVGTATKILNTGGAQIPQVGLTAQQQLATAEQSAAVGAYRDAIKSGDRNKIGIAKDRVGKASDRVSDINRKIDASYSLFEKNKGGLFNTGTLYDEQASRRGELKTGIKDIALPTAVAGLDLYTLGQGAIIDQAIRQGGVKAGLQRSIPNIAKIGGGNFASGGLNTYAEGGNTEQAIKAGLIQSILGFVPDLGLPALTSGFRNKVLPSLFRGKGVNPTDVVDELDDAAISASAEAAIQATRPRAIPIKQNIPINEVTSNPLDVPVSVNTTPAPQGPIIREVGGDAVRATPNDVIVDNVAQIRRDQAAVANNVPIDQRVEGVTPRSSEQPFTLSPEEAATGQGKVINEYADFLKQIGEGNGVDINPATGTRISNNVRFGDTKGKRMSNTAWREEAERQLRAGQADPSIQKIFDESADPEVQALLSKGERPDAPVGRPITVKKATGIDVMDDTKVPQNLPETPGTVRVTEATAPSNAKSEAVASTPTVSTPSSLPKDVQDILDNPKQYNKRQVAAARNQRKLARQMAKTQEDTADAMSRIDAANTKKVEGQSEGFAPTGEFKVGKRGNVSEKATKATEAQAGTKEMADRSVDDLLDEISTKEALSPGDRRRITAAKENLMKTDPEGFRSSDKYQILDKLEKASRSDLGRGLALIPRTIRKTANSDNITARWERRVGGALDDPSKMTNDQWKQVQDANDSFTTARNRANTLEEQFRKSGSEADFKAWEDAYKAARDADTAAKMTEVKVAQRVLKDEKGANVTKVIDELKKEADVNTMDYVTANMLSGTGTGFRNTFGTELAGVENRIGANVRAKVVKGLFGENVGGFDRKGARFGRKFGFSKWTGDAKRRADNGGKNPIEWGKNWSTTINSGGESSMQSQVYSRLAKYYKNQFTDQGFSGKDLDLKMRHGMITDPDNMADTYLDATMKSSGLTGLFEKGQTIERSITDLVGGKTDSKTAQLAAKVAMRMLVGFPTATGNFIYQSGKRLTLGLPSYIESGVKAAKGDKMAAALAFERGLKESGSGSAMLGLGTVLGSSGRISGPYPSDKDERALWEREGISENSIKIGDAWYPIPQGAGMLGLPLLTGAAIGRDGAEGVKQMYNPTNLAKLLPTYQIQGFLNMLSGDGGPQDVKNMIASSVRAVTPVGALLNQIAKSFDDTKNDTTTKDLWSNVFDQVYSGIPGVNNAMNIPDKTDKEGNPIKNPNPLELAFGATSAVQSGGEERTREINSGINSALGQIDQYGLLNDSNMDGVLKETGLDAYNKAKSGKQLDESEIKALREGLVKGVSSEGTDTAYLERDQYATNLAVLQLKRDMMKDDPTVKPSSLKDMDVAIKRGEVYKNNEVPYKDISEYKSTGVEEWRKMGDPESDDYNPEMYEKLWQIDQMMTQAGVSYKKGDLNKNKYAAKKPGKGKGKGNGRGSGSGVRKIDTSFGTLKDMSFTPRVQAYESINTQSGGGVPRIGIKRPNIVHKISSSG